MRPALGGAYARTLSDPMLRQAEGGVLLSQQISREANILAFAEIDYRSRYMACENGRGFQDFMIKRHRFLADIQCR